MNKKKQSTVITSMRSTERKQLLLRDTGKTLKLRTGLKAGKTVKLSDVLVSGY